MSYDNAKRASGTAMKTGIQQTIHAELIAVLVAVTGSVPRVLTLADGSALPAGPLELTHRSLQAGVRAWVERQTHHPLGYIEQLYTFADPTRGATVAGDQAERSISISYLGLTREIASGGDTVSWQDIYRYFPWEDRRSDPTLIERTIRAEMGRWVGTSAERAARVNACFGLDGSPWNEDLALPRYELLYEMGLVREAARDGQSKGGEFIHGAMMQADHRRILATALSRLRAKIKYRAIVYELMPESFSLLELQRCVEALAGQRLHKSNFRRLLASQNLLEETAHYAPGVGRPAKLFRFRAALLAERAIAGTRLPIARP